MSVDRQELFEKLAAMPDRLERIVEQHPTDLLNQASAGGGWGAIDVMAFLRDWDVVTLDRIDQMLDEVEPEFAEEDTELWSIEREYHAEDPEAVTQEVRKGREELINRLTELSEREWSRKARLPDGATITVEDLVKLVVVSDREQIQKLRDILN